MKRFPRLLRQTGTILSRGSEIGNLIWRFVQEELYTWLKSLWTNQSSSNSQKASTALSGTVGWWVMTVLGKCTLKGIGSLNPHNGSEVARARACLNRLRSCNRAAVKKKSNLPARYQSVSNQFRFMALTLSSSMLLDAAEHVLKYHMLQVWTFVLDSTFFIWISYKYRR